MASRLTGAVLDVGDDHVGDADRPPPMPSAFVGVVALDGLGDPRVHAPAAGQDPADEGVVDAELAALGVDAVVGGAAAAVEALGVAGMQAGEHRAADVVEDRGQRELVAVAVAGHLGDAVRGALDGQGVEAEAVGRAGRGCRCR